MRPAVAAEAVTLTRSRSLSRLLPSIPSFPIFFFSSSSSSSSSSASSSSSCSRRNPSHAPLPSLKPPVPKKIPFTVSAQGRSWDDPYHWMSNTCDPDLVDYLERENGYAEAFMADNEALRRRLVTEMKGRMPPRVSTPPERWGPWEYYQYVPEDKEYPVLCRRRGNFNGFFDSFIRGSRKKEVLLDWNEIAEQFGYVQVGTCRVSPDHRYLAYTVDTTGSETFMLHVKDLQNGYIVQGSKVEGVVSVAWARDCNHLLYTACDDTLRPCRVFCKHLGNGKEDDLIFAESDTSCCVDISSTKDCEFITINSNSRSSSEEGLNVSIQVFVMDASDLQMGLEPIRKRAPGTQYFLEHHNGFFYILTNAPSKYVCEGTVDYHIARCRAGKFPLNHWQDIVLPGQDLTIQDMDMFDGHLVLFIHKKGIPMFCSFDMPMKFCQEPKELDDLLPWFFPLPSSICNLAPGSNHDFMSSTYRVVISSPVMPDLIVDYDMTKKKFTVVHQEEVIGLTDTAKDHFQDGTNPLVPKMSLYGDKNSELIGNMRIWGDLSKTIICERNEVTSHDGVRIPLTILYSREVARSRKSPGLLHGYGAYGEILDKSWCPDRISLLNRGWVLAFADVRGGGGGGTSWHQAGVGSRKLNSIHDFIACGKYLISEGYVGENKLSAIGYSAGGLLVSATINLCPELFRAAILKVPFLDACNTMLDPTLPLTILDYEEFGDPRNETDFNNILSYSPYDNIPSGVCVPSILITTCFNDSRVGVWEGAKWVAKIREKSCCACSASVILKTNMCGGHFGEGGRYSHCEDTAFEYAFLIKAMEPLVDANLT